MIASVTKLDLSKYPWMNTAELQTLFKALAAGGGEARFVGGVVRDALLGNQVDDIDLAVNLPPEKVTSLLTAAGIKVVPTGIEHGTVTAVMGHQGYEITTLRRDVETDGRHAKVDFTDDWKADAARRDFTINAIYADAKGRLYDYFNGREDLTRGRVRFIGNPEERLIEDVLRILRYFRFYAAFGHGEADSKAMKACQKLAPLLSQLSAERVWKEINKMLISSNPLPAWKLMHDKKILTHILPEAAHLNRLSRLVELEQKHTRPDAIRRLASLLVWGEAVAKKVAERLRLSNRETTKLQILGKLPARLQGYSDPIPLRGLLYEFGKENIRDALLLLAADEVVNNLDEALRIVDAWEKPVFPLQGTDLMRLGLKESPRMGEILRSVETWWKQKDFQPTKGECLTEVEKYLSGY